MLNQAFAENFSKKSPSTIQLWPELNKPFYYFRILVFCQFMHDSSDPTVCQTSNFDFFSCDFYLGTITIRIIILT